MIAGLMGPPLLLRPWEIARLTDLQIAGYYHHPRDERGRIKRDTQPMRAQTQEEQRLMMESIARAFGLEVPEHGRQQDDTSTP